MGNASVKLVLRKAKRRPDGTAPVYLRAIHSRQVKESATGVWVEPKAWNADKQEVRKSHPVAVPFNARLEDLRLKALGAATKAQSATDVFRGRSGSLSGFLRGYIDGLPNDAFWEKKKYETTARKLHAALGQQWPGGSLPWDSLGPSAIDRFARYCREVRGNSANTCRKEVVRLRTICKKAVLAGDLPPELDPFLRYTLPKGAPIKRRRLSLGELEALRMLELLSGTRKCIVRDLFLLSVYGHGIRISDALRLTPSSVVEDEGDARLVYRMQKTGSEMTPKLPPVAARLLRPYLASAKPGAYLFPLLKPGDDADPVSLRKRQQAATVKANKTLKALGEMAGIGGDGLSTHCARHSFADASRKRGDLFAVSKALGHKNLQTTQAYLASFDQTAVDNLSDSLWNDDSTRGEA